MDDFLTYSASLALSGYKTKSQYGKTEVVSFILAAPSIMSSLQGKVALITGSSRGIGAGIAIALAKEGADIVINYASDSSKARAEEVAQAIESHGVKSLVVKADLSSLEDIENLVSQTVNRFGKIDILVNNSGILQPEPVGDITREAYAKVMDVNLRAPIFLSQTVVPFMSEGSRIINVSSVVARVPYHRSTVYSATKAALESVTRTFSLELRDKGILVNTINPAATETEGFLSFMGQSPEDIRKAMPMAKVEDIADVVVFLAGPKSRWMTGSTVSVNNGVVLN